MSTALNIPRRSHRGMAVDDKIKITRYQPNVDGKVVNKHYDGFMRGFSSKTFLKYQTQQLFMCVDTYIFIKPDRSTTDIQ